MNCLKHAGAIGAILIATAAATGCGDNAPPTTTETTGQIAVLVPASPGNVATIHVAVTGTGITGSVDTDLVQLHPGDPWTGMVLDVPPGTGRTVTASASDASDHVTFTGAATAVTVFAGKLTSVSITLTPTGGTTFPGTNTPPHFTSLIHPDAILSTETATLFATAADPDAATTLTYTWSVVSGGGSVSPVSNADQDPDTQVSTEYTPVHNFTGFAVIQVAVTDTPGGAITTTSFPIAVGAGVVPAITFNVLPDLTMNVDRPSLMPGGTSPIEFTLTNPTQPWTPAAMHVHTTWSATCGTFDSDNQDLDFDINRGSTASPTVTYTAPPGPLDGVLRCDLTLALKDRVTHLEMHFTTSVWIDPPMVMFVSSATITGGQFAGAWETADQFCQGLANANGAAVPPGTYHALLSFNEISAKDRLIDAPYIRVDGAPIARNKDELFSVDLLNAVHFDEKQEVVEDTAVFTGTIGVGSAGVNCASWTSNASNTAARTGNSDATANPDWTNSGSFTCDSHLPIYCVQQPSEE